MSDRIKIAIDAMGGDYAPVKIVEGAILAIKERDDFDLVLVGDKHQIEEVLSKHSYPKERIQIEATTEVITTEESPVLAIRKKKDSSLVRSCQLVKEGKVSALCSAGSTGAVLVGGQVLIGKAKGIARAPLAPLLPTKHGRALLIDCGANVDARVDHLVQFAHIGSLYMNKMLGVKDPKVALLNIGVEEEKGNALTKAVYPILKEDESINFIGNVEARDILETEADVIVTEAFAGNVALKVCEGVAKGLFSEIKEALMSSLIGKIGGLLIKPSLKGLKSKFDASEYGGAPLLGLKGLVVKMHGNAKEKDVKNSIFQCAGFIHNQMVEEIEKLGEK